ncbi:hypothetical protein ACOCJ5_07450 [Knoellia sp. CPCC 206450]|uniref:hypothetical protein n=1 Tax=Knoellia tibetensis TaxID=3404798 RepID=UPI003B42DFD8
MIRTADDLIAEATRRLGCAANLAQQPDTPAGDAFAAQIRLTRATLTTAPSGEVPDDPRGTSVVAELERALAALDLIDPLEGPPELLLAAWNIAELTRLARRNQHPA